MKALLAVVLSLGLIGSVNATMTETPVLVGDGGFSNLSGGSQFVLGAVAAVFVAAAIENNKYNCVITKTAPKPGTNYTNQVSTCTLK